MKTSTIISLASLITAAIFLLVIAVSPASAGPCGILPQNSTNGWCSD